jgi:hypothetical protein
MRRLIFVLACGALVALPAYSQQPVGEPNVLDRIDSAVRGFFNRLLGGGESKPGQAAPAQTLKPKPGAEEPSAQPAAAPAQSTDAAPEPAFKGTPIARAADRGLHEAITRDDYESALKMIEQGADIEARDAEAGGSVLHFAVMKGKLPIIDLLVTRGADINSRTKTGTTPLHTAVLYGQLHAMEYLAAKGADVNAQSASGTTPLRLAIATKKETIAARLKELGAR